MSEDFFHDASKLPGEQQTLDLDIRVPVAFAVAANGKHVLLKGSSKMFLGAGSDESLDECHTWHQSKHARSSIVALLSCLYALVLVILALAFEVSVIQEQKSSLKYELFYIYLYVVALAFFAYMYCFLLRPSSSKASPAFGRFKLSMGSFRRLLHANQTVQLIPEDGQSPAASPMPEDASEGVEKRRIDYRRQSSVLLRLATHSAPSAGSMYLKLGGVVFGIVGVISNAMTVLSRYESSCLTVSETVVYVLSSIFVFVQLYFIFMNSKLTIHSFQNVGRAGMMHVVATNLCVWIKCIILEEFHVMAEIGESIQGHSSPQKNHSAAAQATPVDKSLESVLHDCKLSEMEVHLEDAQPFMTTCLIEYSILCAAITYVLWRNIGWDAPMRSKNRKHAIRVDCSSSAGGLFIGLLFVVFTIISMIVFFVKVHIHDDETALWVFYGSFSVLYSSATIGCIVGMYQMRNLKYVPPRRMAGIILLDDILLCVSLFGQLCYCFFSMMTVNANDLIEYVSLTTNCIRVFEVLLQTIFILSGQRLVSNSQTKKPGREVIVFLLVLNIALWLINTFETQKASVNPLMVDFYGKGPWTIIVHSTIPLCIFYRFHCSVCLAEIWKSVYRTKAEH